MMKFRLTQRCESYEHCYVEAATKEEALKQYQDGFISTDGPEWKFDECGESALIAVDEVVSPGENICHDVQDGKFVENLAD